MPFPPPNHLDRLEAESLHILREVAAEFRNPVMLYSIGKDSSVLLHLLQKAFAPARSPIPLLHVDTGWKFREMIAFRDRRAAETGIPLTVHTNPEGRAQGIFVKTAKGIETVALLDQKIPGGKGEFEVFNNFTQPSINDKGEVVFYGQIKNSDVGIFYRDEKGVLHTLVKRGDKMPK